MKKEIEYSIDTFGGRLQKLRTDSGLKRYELYDMIFGTKTDIEQNDFRHKRDSKGLTIRRWESGETYPSVESLAKICEIFHCNPDFLMGYKTDDKKRFDEFSDADCIHHFTGLPLSMIHSLISTRMRVYQMAGRNIFDDTDSYQESEDITDRKLYVLEEIYNSQEIIDAIDKLVSLFRKDGKPYTFDVELFDEKISLDMQKQVFLEKIKKGIDSIPSERLNSKHFLVNTNTPESFCTKIVI